MDDAFTASDDSSQYITLGDSAPLHVASPLTCCSRFVDAAVPPQYKENLEQRMKYTDQPEKFMDSEVDLDEQVKSLLQVCGCSTEQVAVAKWL